MEAIACWCAGLTLHTVKIKFICKPNLHIAISGMWRCSPFALTCVCNFSKNDLKAQLKQASRLRGSSPFAYLYLPPQKPYSNIKQGCMKGCKKGSKCIILIHCIVNIPFKSLQVATSHLEQFHAALCNHLCSFARIYSALQNHLCQVNKSRWFNRIGIEWHR